MALGFYTSRNEATRVDVFEELSHTALAAVRAFFRRLGAPHLVEEHILPTLEEGDAQLYAAVRDRPWPPWGLGARHMTALCMVQEIGSESYSVSPVYVADEEATNIGMIAALYKEVLEGLLPSPNAELNYLVAEGSVLGAAVLEHAGFKRYDDVFLTEHGRYFTYRAPVAEVMKHLGLDEIETPDLLAHE